MFKTLLLPKLQNVANKIQQQIIFETTIKNIEKTAKIFHDIGLDFEYRAVKSLMTQQPTFQYFKENLGPRNLPNLLNISILILRFAPVDCNSDK